MLVVEPSDSAYNVSIHQAPLPEHSVRIVVLIIHSSDPPFFLKGREVNFSYLPRKGENEKIQKEGGSMGQGQIFLKEGGWHFPYLIFSRFIIFTFRNYFTLCKIVLCIWRKTFSSTIIYEKGHSKYEEGNIS